MNNAAIKSHYAVFQFDGGQFGICELGTFGGNCIYGGDSANEDDYNKEHMIEVYVNWDGTLVDGRIEL